MNGYTQQQTVMENGQPPLPRLILNLEHTAGFTSMMLKETLLFSIGMCQIHICAYIRNTMMFQGAVGRQTPL